jgi:hypothetical protein
MVSCSFAHFLLRNPRRFALRQSKLNRGVDCQTNWCNSLGGHRCTDHGERDGDCNSVRKSTNAGGRNGRNQWIRLRTLCCRSPACRAAFHSTLD